MRWPGRWTPARARATRTGAPAKAARSLRRLAWGPVLGFGLVSLAADVVSDGARPLAGPLLAQLGASALLVGLVTGGAEAAAQGLRLVFGPWADRTRKYWTFTVAGYALTAVCVPLLAAAPAAGAAGLALAAALIIGDRVGKAVRSPAKTVLLAAVAKPVGRGRGFAVHKGLDLVGALLGPLLVSVVLSASGALPWAFAVLAVPAAASLVLLVRLRRRVGDVAGTDPVRETVPVPGSGPAGAIPLPRHRLPPALSGVFVLYSAVAFFWSAGLVAFGVISFHLITEVAVAVAVVPLMYAGAMGAAALGALVTGIIYDRAGAAVLLVVPVLISAVPVLALAPGAGPVLAGVLIWGIATGVRDSTVKALIADMVPEWRQGTAYGIFAAFEGAGALAGGALYGVLYADRPALIASVAVLQAAALALLIAARRMGRRRGFQGPGPPE